MTQDDFRNHVAQTYTDLSQAVLVSLIDQFNEQLKKAHEQSPKDLMEKIKTVRSYGRLHMEFKEVLLNREIIADFLDYVKSRGWYPCGISLPWRFDPHGINSGDRLDEHLFQIGSKMFDSMRSRENTIELTFDVKPFGMN